MTDSVRNVLDRVPALGNIEAAVAAGQRRRRTQSAGVLATTAVLVVAGAVGLDAWTETPPDTTPATVERPLVEWNDPVAISDAVGQWRPDPPLVGAPAPGGTVLAEHCPDDCSIVLIAPDGTTIPLTEVSEGLSALVTNARIENVSLSYDADWMALSADDGLRLQPLTPERANEPVLLEPSVHGARWRVIEWGSGSLNASLVEQGPTGAPTRYAVIDLTSGLVDIVDAPEPETFGPSGHFGIGPLLTVYAKTDAAEDARSTDVKTYTVPTAPGTGWPVGKVAAVSEIYTDVSPLLAMTESVTDPATALVELRTPPSEDDEVWPRLTVFEGDSRRSGIIELRTGNPTRMPYADPRGAEQLLGAGSSETAVFTESTQGSTRILGRGPSGTQWTHSLPGTATYILPGLTVQNR